jgi:hypothetical protein
VLLRVLVDYQERVKDRLEEQAENEDGEEASEEMLFAIEDDQNLLSDMNKVSACNTITLVLFD